MTHPLHRAYINDHVDEWRLTDLKAEAPPKPSGPQTGLAWAAAIKTTAMQTLTTEVFALNAHRRAKRLEKSK